MEVICHFHLSHFSGILTFQVDAWMYPVITQIPVIPREAEDQICGFVYAGLPFNALGLKDIHFCNILVAQPWTTDNVIII